MDSLSLLKDMTFMVVRDGNTKKVCILDLTEDELCHILLLKRKHDVVEIALLLNESLKPFVQ